MLGVQWKKFLFFERELVRDEQWTELLSSMVVNATAAGRGQLVLGASNGGVAVVNRELRPLTAWQAHEYAVTHVQQLLQRNVVLTVGNDVEAASPTVKLWNLDKLDKHGAPLLMRSLSLPKADPPLPVTAFRATEDLTQVAVGLCNGTVVVVRGSDVARDRFARPRSVHTGSDDPVTGLFWQMVPRAGAPPDPVLFVVSSGAVSTVWTASKDRLLSLDMKGADMGCATQSDDGDLVLARPEAVYFYMAEGPGACFGFEGPKQLVHWFRGYLLVVGANASRPTSPGSSSTGVVGGGRLGAGAGQQRSSLQIYDLRNKFIAFNDARLPPIQHVVSEWGSIFLFAADGQVFQLEEKDMQTKLDMLFKRNLYHLAVSLAESQHYDRSSIVDIYRKYGDHLYDKGDFDGAMTQYLLTIGKLEPSYVIRKFLDAQRIHNLTSYLQALHEQNLANADHTTLLLNCYTKLKDVEKLNQFIRSGPSSVGSPGATLNFDVGTAIRVCRQASYFEHALYLGKVHEEHDLVLKILLEDLKDYLQAIRYMATLDFLDADRNLKTYGKVLMDHLPAATTDLVYQLCTEYTPLPPETVDAGGAGAGAGGAPSKFGAGVGAAANALHMSHTDPHAAAGSGVSSTFSSLMQKADSARADFMGALSSATSKLGDNLGGGGGAAGMDDDLPEVINLDLGALDLGAGGDGSEGGAPGLAGRGAGQVMLSSMHAEPEDFIQIFVGQPEWLVKFLERVVRSGRPADSVIFTTLLELYLKGHGEAPAVAAASGDDGPTSAVTARQKAVDLIDNPQAQLDPDAAMVLCHQHSFSEGILRLYEARGMYQEILEHHMAQGDAASILQACRRHGDKDPNLWMKVLGHFASQPTDCTAEITEVLSYIDQGNLLPPLLVIQILAQSPSATLGLVKEFLLRRVREMNAAIEEDERVARASQEETAKMRQEIAELRKGHVTFQSNKCSLCTSPLDLPAVHFLCKHSFHQRCIGDTDVVECPRCAPENAKVLQYKQAQEESASRHEEFFKQLQGAEDGFSTAASYFGRGLFPRTATTILEQLKEADIGVTPEAAPVAVSAASAAPVARSARDFMEPAHFYRPPAATASTTKTKPTSSSASSSNPFGTAATGLSSRPSTTTASSASNPFGSTAAAAKDTAPSSNPFGSSASSGGGEDGARTATKRTETVNYTSTLSTAAPSAADTAAATTNPFSSPITPDAEPTSTKQNAGSRLSSANPFAQPKPAAKTNPFM